MAKSVKRNAKEKCFGQEIEIFREEMRTMGDMNAGIWIIFNHQRADLEIIGGEDQSRQIWSKGPAVTYTTYI